MATAFDTFNQYADRAYPGQLQDRGMADVVSLVAVGSDIGYGVAVREVSENTAQFATGSEVSHGITVRESMHDNPAGDNPEPVYAENETMSVLRVGRIVVATVDGAAFGDDVFVVPDTGELTNTANTATNIQLANAQFKSAAGAGELAVVQLNGAE